MDIKRIKRRFADLKLAVIGYKHGNPPDRVRIRRLAYIQAMVEESDERALAAIADDVQRHPKAAREARERFTGLYYDGDRAIRLINAAMHGMPMQPIRPECVESFGQEARLGRMPLREAFAEMVSREPELEGITQRFEDGHAALMASRHEHTERKWNHDAFVMLRDAQREVDETIGPMSQHPDPLLRSYISRNIAYCWLRNISGTPPRTDPDASYFSRFETEGARDQ